MEGWAEGWREGMGRGWGGGSGEPTEREKSQEDFLS